MDTTKPTIHIAQIFKELLIDNRPMASNDLSYDLEPKTVGIFGWKGRVCGYILESWHFNQLPLLYTISNCMLNSLIVIPRYACSFQTKLLLH